jgi:hypothetical protein
MTLFTETVNVGDIAEHPCAFVTVTDIGLLAVVTFAVGVLTPVDHKYVVNGTDVESVEN